MNELAQTITMIITAVVSVSSLVLSIVNYFNRRPHLKIKINNKKLDCFYTLAGSEKDEVYRYVSIIYFNIINNSPVKITINNVLLKIKNEFYLLSSNDKNCWNSINFFEKMKDGHFESDEIYRDLKSSCIRLPMRIEPYDSTMVSSVFNSNPKNLKGKVKAKIILNTAIGSICKRVILSEYGLKHFNHEFESVSQFQRSIVDRNKIKKSVISEEET